MSWEQRVNRVVDHVRGNLRGDLSLDALARIAWFSPYHFSRVFKTVTGERLSTFIQRARLERAATLMKARPERELGDVAHEVGFSAASDFSRVFKGHYGIAPSKWDRASALHAPLDGFDDGLAAFRGTVAFEPRLVEHLACRIAYVRVATPFLDADLLQQGYDTLTGWFDAHGIDWRRQQLLGLSWDNYETTPLDKVRFDLGFTVPDGVRVDEPLGEQSFAATRAVDVHVRGGLAHIALAWEHLYDVWLPSSRSEPADLPGIKRFRRRPDELGWRDFDLDCSIALQAASQ